MSGEPIAGSIAISLLSDMSMHDHDEHHGPSSGPDTLNGLPYNSLVCLGMPDSPYSFGFSRGVSRTSIDMRPETELGTPRKAHGHEQTAAQMARRAFEDREIASEATPLRKRPDEIIAGRPGLVRSLMLNDRQHVLTVDTEGEVAAWNIIKGICIGRFSAAEVAAALDLERGIEAGSAIRKHSNEVLEMVKQRVEGETMVITWCQVDTRIGSLVVHLEEGRAFDAEVYADELDVDAGIKEDMRGASGVSKYQAKLTLSEPRQMGTGEPFPRAHQGRGDRTRCFPSYLVRS
jgi:WD repeat-containing protein 48